jgi:hypothetical protein
MIIKQAGIAPRKAASSAWVAHATKLCWQPAIGSVAVEVVAIGLALGKFR